MLGQIRHWLPALRIPTLLHARHNLGERVWGTGDDEYPVWICMDLHKYDIRSQGQINRRVHRS